MLLLFAFLYDSRIYYTSYTRSNCLWRYWHGKANARQRSRVTHTCINWHGKRPVYDCFSKYGFADVLSLDHVGLDPSRIAAQVVTGVGFIGAGNILVRNQNIVGLTTAADIWVTAAIGMVIGSGMYELGIYGSVMTLLVLEVFHQLTFRLMNKNYHLQLTLVNGNTVSMLDWFKQQKIKTDLVSLQENEDHEVVAIDIQLHATTSIEDLLRLLKGMAGVKGVSIS